MIPQRNISLLSNRLAKAGGHRIPEAVLERDYCLAWFLVGLSRSPLRDVLAFKGGTALKRCYIGYYRFSEDLDFSLAKATSLETILAGMEKIFADVKKASAPRSSEDGLRPIGAYIPEGGRRSEQPVFWVVVHIYQNF